MLGPFKSLIALDSVDNIKYNIKSASFKNIDFFSAGFTILLCYTKLDKNHKMQHKRRHLFQYLPFEKNHIVFTDVVSIVVSEFLDNFHSISLKSLLLINDSIQNVLLRS